MDAVGIHIVALCIAVRALQRLGAVQKFPAVGFTHLHDGAVVLVQLFLVQAGIDVAAPDGRHRVDDDVHAGVGFLHRLDAGLVILDKGIHVGAGVVGAEGDDDPLRLHQRHGLRHGDVVGISGKLHAGVAFQLPGRHAHRADGVVVAAIVEHPVHARRVGVAQKQRAVNIILAGVLGLGQHGAVVLRRVDGVGALVVVAARYHRAVAGSFLALSAGRVHRHKCPDHSDQQRGAAQRQHKKHPAAHIHPLPEIAALCRPGLSLCHTGSFPGAAARQSFSNITALILHPFGEKRNSVRGELS